MPPKLLTFISVFDNEIQENLNLIWKQQLEELVNKNLSKNIDDAQ